MYICIIYKFKFLATVFRNLNSCKRQTIGQPFNELQMFNNYCTAIFKVKFSAPYGSI